ncbi:MAG: RDD family protein [Bdellovibrionales bacterium]|nr:RDD family protein [Bdellovibrionales bacterium]
MAEPARELRSEPSPSPTTAELPARFLAALIDYFVVSAFLLLGSKLLVYNDAMFLGTLLIGGLYFTLGASRLFDGQTLGKRLFGIRVVSARGERLQLLPLSPAFLRYLLLFGFPILAAEIPPYFYRLFQISAAPAVLELHMLVVMLYTAVNGALLIVDPLHRGIHDRVAGTCVVRNFDPLDEVPFELPRTSLSDRFTVLTIVGALAAGFGLWLPAAVHSPSAALIARNQYVIEGQLPVQIARVAEERDALRLDLIVTTTTSDADPKSDENEVPASISSLATDVTDLVQQQAVLQQMTAPALRFTFYTLDSARNPLVYRYPPGDEPTASQGGSTNSAVHLLAPTVLSSSKRT